MCGLTISDGDDGELVQVNGVGDHYCPKGAGALAREAERENYESIKERWGERIAAASARCSGPLIDKWTEETLPAGAGLHKCKCGRLTYVWPLANGDDARKMAEAVYELGRASVAEPAVA